MRHMRPRMPRPTALLCLCATLVALCAPAAPRVYTQEPAGQQAPGNAREALQQALKLADSAKKAYDAAEYEKAAELAEEVTKLVARAPNTRLILARAHARLGRKEQALAALARSVKDGLTGAEKLEDEAFDALRDAPEFQALQERLKESDRRAAAGLEPVPVQLEGVKTVEGRPEGGFPWRIRMSPEADEDRPQRLIVWLHPSGGSMNPTIERISPHFIDNGYALMVVAAKPWRWWRDAHVKKLVEKTLPDAAHTPGIDATRPVLFGYSAGGQAALQMWEADPKAYAGLVLDAAYPTDMEFYRKNRHKEDRFRVLDLPAAAVEDRTPFFVLVGGRDPGARLWKEAEAKWEGKLPLTMHYVPGQGHTWLLGREQFEDLLRWLNDIKPEPAQEPADGSTE